VEIFARTNQNFRPPDDLSAPLIMVGPGTGVAPYIGFLQERQLRMEKEGKQPSDIGETWLLYGCRNEKKDFLFRCVDFVCLFLYVV
jgi:methionine synthase reductase